MIPKIRKVLYATDLSDNSAHAFRYAVNMAKGNVIVMGTHARDAIAHAFIGSVAERVLRRSKKPVFIIPLPEGETHISFRDA